LVLEVYLAVDGRNSTEDTLKKVECVGIGR